MSKKLATIKNYKLQKPLSSLPTSESISAERRPILPDVLVPGLRVVFCGTAAGTLSAAARCYYAAPGNKFWKTLYQIGLTPRLIAPTEFSKITQFGIGLTDLNKQSFGPDSTLKFTQDDRDHLRAKLLRFAPQVIAFNSKNALEKFFNRRTTFGRQTEKIGNSTLFVLPSTSGLACRSWDVTYWMELGSFLNAAPLQDGTSIFRISVGTP